MFNVKFVFFFHLWRENDLFAYLLLTTERVTADSYPNINENPMYSRKTLTENPRKRNPEIQFLIRWHQRCWNSCENVLFFFENDFRIQLRQIYKINQNLDNEPADIIGTKPFYKMTRNQPNSKLEKNKTKKFSKNVRLFITTSKIIEKWKKKEEQKKRRKYYRTNKTLHKKLKKNWHENENKT